MNSMPPIRMLVLTLTGRCNFACRYCYASDVDAVDMDEDTAVKAVMMAGASGERFLLQFSGGEPLVRKSDIIRLCDAHPDCTFTAFTNGTLIDRAAESPPEPVIAARTRTPG